MTNDPVTILRVTELGIRRSERWLFRELSFDLVAGEVVQIIGQNGTGKTSLMRSLCGFLTQKEGLIEWLTIDDKICIPIFLGHLSAVKPELTVTENLSYHPIGGKFYDESTIKKVIEEVGLFYYADTSARNLSAGQIRRVSLARLLLAETKCWILDEPFTSLDVEGCSWLESKISQFVEQGGAVLLTSHQSVNLKVSPRTLSLTYQNTELC